MCTAALHAVIKLYSNEALPGEVGRCHRYAGMKPHAEVGYRKEEQYVVLGGSHW